MIVIRKTLSERLRENKYNVFIVLLLIFDFILRCQFLSSNSIDLDEPFSLFYSQMGVRDIVRNLISGNNPPLYEIMLHFWIKLTGLSPFAVRFPSLVFSVATIWVVYRIGGQFINKRTGVLSALLLSFSVTHVYFSHEARVYSLFIFLTALSFLLFFHLIRKKVSVRILVFLTVTYILLAYSHYFGLLIIAFQLFAILIIKPVDPKARRKYFLAFTAFLISYIPFISIVVSRFLDSAAHGTWIARKSDISDLFYIFKNYSNDDRYCMLFILIIVWGGVWNFFKNNLKKELLKSIFSFLLIPLFFFISFSVYFDLPFFWRFVSFKNAAAYFAAIILILFIVELVRTRRKADVIAIVVAWFVIPYALLFLISYFIPVFLNRYLVFVLPAFFILIAVSVDKLFSDKQSFSLVSFALLMFMLGTFTANPHNTRYSDKIASDVKSEAGPGTKIIICPRDYYLAFSYYYCMECFKDYDNIVKRLEDENVFLLNDTNSIGAIVDSSDRAIFVDAHSEFTFPGNGIAEWFEKRYSDKKTIGYPDSSKVIVFSEAR